MAVLMRDVDTKVNVDEGVPLGEHIPMYRGGSFHRSLDLITHEDGYSQNLLPRCCKGKSCFQAALPRLTSYHSTVGPEEACSM